MSTASAGLRSGTESTQYVMRMGPTATIAAVNDLGRVLLLWQHRFIIGRWGPGDVRRVRRPGRRSSRRCAGSRGRDGLAAV